MTPGAPPRERGQATVETVALIPAMVAIGLVALQLLVVGYASVRAGTAAGSDARAGVRESLPGWSKAGARVGVTDGRVEVRVRPPSPLRALSERMEVTGTAAVEAP